MNLFKLQKNHNTPVTHCTPNEVPEIYFTSNCDLGESRTRQDLSEDYRY